MITLNSVIQRVCAELPKGVRLNIVCEYGSAYVCVETPLGCFDVDGTEAPLEDQILSGLDVARRIVADESGT